MLRLSSFLFALSQRMMRIPGGRVVVEQAIEFSVQIVTVAGDVRVR